MGNWNWLPRLGRLIMDNICTVSCTNNTNILCSGPWQQSLPQHRMYQGLDSLNWNGLPWSSCHRASRLPGLLLSTFLKRTSHKCSMGFKSGLRDGHCRSSTWERSRNLFTLDFMARSIDLLEDKCFTLTIKWRSWRQHVVPQHPHVLVLLHGAFTPVELTEPSPDMHPQTIRETPAVLYCGDNALWAVPLTNPPPHYSPLLPTEKLKGTLVQP